MTATLHEIRDAAIERQRGQEFHERMQKVLHALAHWRRLVVIELDAASDDENELDTLHHEMTECGKIIRRMAATAEQLKQTREVKPWI